MKYPDLFTKEHHISGCVWCPTLYEILRAYFAFEYDVKDNDRVSEMALEYIDKMFEEESCRTTESLGEPFSSILYGNLENLMDKANE